MATASAPSQHILTSRSGREITRSPFGLGKASLGNLSAAQSEGSSVAAIPTARDAGLIHFDTAPRPIMARIAQIEGMCPALGVPLAQAAGKLPLKHSVVASVIPGGATAPQIAQNIAACRAPMPDVLWRDLSAAKLFHPELDLDF